MKLLVDIGNTRIKWATETSGVISASQAITYRQHDFLAMLQAAFEPLNKVDVLAVSSVGKQKIVEQILTLVKTIWPSIETVAAKATAQGFSITNAYKDASKLGVDRWLGLIALQYYYGENSCVIDCGTAITIDVLAEKGQHLGGLISPGLGLMKQALFQGTENLSNSLQEGVIGLSCTTHTAIFSGTVLAAAGLIDKVVDEFSVGKIVILTGGDAELLSKQLKCQVVLEPDFILKGLALYAKGEGE